VRRVVVALFTWGRWWAGERERGREKIWGLLWRWEVCQEEILEWGALCCEEIHSCEVGRIGSRCDGWVATCFVLCYLCNLFFLFFFLSFFQSGETLFGECLNWRLSQVKLSKNAAVGWTLGGLPCWKKREQTEWGGMGKPRVYAEGFYAQASSEEILLSLHC